VAYEDFKVILFGDVVKMLRDFDLLKLLKKEELNKIMK